MNSRSNASFFARYFSDLSVPQWTEEDWSHASAQSRFPLPWGDYEVYDFTQGYDPHRTRSKVCGVGRYNEHRPTMYKGEQYAQDARDTHVGIDLASPGGTPVFNVLDGEVLYSAYNDLPYDYGGTVITSHDVRGKSLYILYGHLSKDSVAMNPSGQRVHSGHILGHLGEPSENGGWNPHLHIQLSFVKPRLCDLPGAVSKKDLAQALLFFPDPQLILGRLYESSL